MPWVDKCYSPYVTMMIVVLWMYPTVIPYLLTMMLVVLPADDDVMLITDYGVCSTYH